MLNILDYLHKCKVLHADIKPDNFLINELPSSLDYFDPSRTKMLVLIDFNRGIDQKSLPDQQEFTAKAGNKTLLCCEMKSDKAWSNQVRKKMEHKIVCLLFIVNNFKFRSIIMVCFILCIVSFSRST